MGREMGLDRLLADRSRSVVRSDDPDVIKEYVQLRLAVAMTYQEYNDRRNAILSAYHDWRIDLPDMQSKLADLNREYESSHPTSTFDNWTERAEEALAKMKETHRKVKEEWAHAYVDGDKV